VEKQSYFHTVKSMQEMPGFIDVARAKTSRVFPYNLTSRMPPWALSARATSANTPPGRHERYPVRAYTLLLYWISALF